MVTFTANFKSVPPPLPPEYWSTLFSVIVTALIGTWLIPNVISWAKTKEENRMINVYHKRINSLYDDGKLDENDINSLDNLKADFADAYAKGKVSKQHYTNLKEEISVLYEEIYKKRIDLLQDDLFSERSLVFDAIF